MSESDPKVIDVEYYINNTRTVTWRDDVIAAAWNALCDSANRPLAFLIGAGAVMAIMLRAESPLLALLAGGGATLAPVVVLAGEYRLIRAADRARRRS